MKNITKEQLINENDLLKAKIAELEKNKKLSQLITENTTDNIAITTFDLKAKYLYVSPSVKHVLGYDPEEMVGKSFFDFIHPADKKVLLSMGKKYIKLILTKALNIDNPKIAKTIEFRFRDKAGNWRNMQSSVNFVGKNLLAVTRDITGQKKAQEALLQRENYLSALNRTKEILLTSEPENAFQHFVDILGPASNASRTYIFINHKNENGELLMSQKAEYCADGIKPEIDNPGLQNLKYDEFYDIWNSTLLKGEVISGKINDFPKEEREHFLIQDIKTIIIIPIMTDKECIGFIGFDNCVDEREWDTAEQDFLKAAANDLARFVERNKSQEQLMAEFIRFQTTMDAIDAGVYVADMNTYELLFSNKAFNKLFGDKISEKCFSVIQKGQKEPCDFCTNHLLLDENGNPKEPYIWEYQNPITKQWYQLRDQAIQWPDGRIVRLEISTDITERKNAEETIKRNLEFQKLISTLSSGFVGIFDLDDSINKLLKNIGKYADASRSYVFRLRNNGKTMDNTHERCAEGVASQIDNLQNQPGDTFPWMMSKLHKNEIIHIKDVSTLPLEAQAEKEIFEIQNIKSLIVFPLNIFGKLIGFIGFDNVREAKAWSIETIKILKISSEILANTIHSKNAENELKISEENYKSNFENKGSATGVFGDDKVIKTCNSKFEELSGYSKQEIEGKMKWSDFVVEGDMEKILKYHIQRTAQTGNPPEYYECSIKKKNGGQIYCSVNIGMSGTLRVVSLIDITDRKQAEKALQESENKFKSFAEHSPNMIFINQAGKIKYVNKACVQLMGYTESEFYSEHFDFRVLVAPEYIDLINVNFKKQSIGKDVEPHEYAVISKNGNRINAIINSKLIDFEGSKAILGVITDITERKKIEDVLRESEEKLRNFMNTTTTGIWCFKSESPLDIDQPVEKQIDIFMQSVCVECNETYAAMMGTTRDKIIGIKLYEVLPDCEETRDYLRAFINEGYKLDGGETHEISKTGEERYFSNSFVANIIDNKVIEAWGTQMDITERKKAEKALQESEEKFRSVIKSMDDIVFVMDKENRFVSVNADSNDLYLKPELFLGKKHSEVIPKHIDDLYNKALINVKKGKTEEYEYPLEIPDGIHWYSSKLSPILNKGEFDGSVSVVRDITEKKQIEQVLQESQSRFKAFSEATYEGIFITENGVVIDVNEAACDMSGYSYNELIRKSALALIADESKELAGKNMLSGYNKPYDAIAIRKDGTKFYVEILAREFDYKGKKARMTAVRDITNRKKTEEALKESEDKFRSIFEAVTDGILYVDKTIKILDVNSAFTSITGIAKEEVIGKTGFYLAKKFASIKQLPNIIKLIKAKIVNKPVKSIELEFNNKILEVFASETSYGGEIVGVVRDITRKKQIEQVLQESEERFRRLSDLTFEGLFIHDKGIIIDLNLSLAKMFGYSREELLGKNVIEEFAHKDDRQKILKNIIKDYALPYEVVGMKKDGTLIPLEVEAKNVVRDDGEVIKVTAIRDITLRKQAEAALKESEYRFKALSEATREAIFISEKGICIETNEAAVNMFGYSYDEIIGIFGTDVIAPESRELVKSNMMSGFEKPYDAIAQRKDGSKFHAEFHGRMYEYKGKKVRLTAVRDISVRKKHEILLQESKEKLQQFNIQLLDLVEAEVEKSREKDRMMQIQSKQAALGEMVGNIAHQWRQPLNEIGLYIQNLQDKYEFEELTAENLNETVEKTMNKLEYMSQTIEDFRNFFRSDKEKTRFLLNISIDKALSLTKASFKNCSIQIILNLQEGIYITGYPNEFSQVVLNILNNAKDILVEREIENPQVIINLSGQDKKVILTISDNAGGINEDIIDKIFEPYFTTRDKITGTGLGLYISKTIIERNMAGRLSVKNIKDGVEFKIEL